MTTLSDLVATSERVGATAARLAKIEALATQLRALTPDEVPIAVSYLSGSTRQGRLGVGGATLSALAAVPAAPAPLLSVCEVDAALAALTAERGKGAATRRSQQLRALFARATDSEQGFLARLLVGELRQGANEGVMLEAIAAASGVPAPEVRRAAMYAGSLGELARLALGGDIAALASVVQLRVFSPVAPMLAQTAADVGEALALLGPRLALEWKMDGARIQVHKQADAVRVYTRSLKEVTAAVPEIVAAVRGFSADTLVLDGEAIALDAEGRPHPFQVTMRRFGRRLEVETLRATLPIQAFFFDCLRLGAQTLVSVPTRERYAALAQAVPGAQQMPRLLGADAAQAEAFYAAALAAGHEGVMAKDLEAAYEAGNRGASWLKIKRAHTLDLVVLAAEWGHGRRTGQLSNLHLGALEPATGRYVMLGKTFKGLTDAMLAWQTQQLLRLETHRDPLTVYVRPALVVEIAFSDLQASSRYPGGLALRLARVKRYRDDKQPGDADTMESVRRIAAAQTLGASDADA
ncbi:MAG: ATP-dependent DNA ligase [Gammaproteobacteria bacterium]|nr:ATP-dependent DNA ligase [Gammaproteobacteria bacterium]